MDTLIYGAGAVGMGLASCLLKACSNVTLLARRDTADALNTNGLIRTGIFGDYHAKPENFTAVSSLDQLRDTAFDYILVCTKSPDTDTAAKDLSQHTLLFNENTKILLCQNGWGNAEIFKNYFPSKIIYNARVITGFTRPQKNHVEITVHADAIHIGSLFDQKLSGMHNLCMAINIGGIPSELTPDIEKDLWAKMLYNCALNPLGAILDVPYGRLAAHTSTRKLMDSIIKEVFSVLTAAGYKTHWSAPDQFLEIFYEKLVPDTARHRSSTLQDIRAKKKTEIEALNGAVIKLAALNNISVPYNSSIYNIIKFIEAENI